MFGRIALLLAATLGFAANASAATFNESAFDGPIRHDRRLVHRRLPYRHCCGIYRFVYAESWYGFKRVVAPVRHALHGDQVLLPGGAWVYCSVTCEYTLRRQSLDFWQGQGAGGDDQTSPGYFRWNFYLD